MITLSQLNTAPLIALLRATSAEISRLRHRLYQDDVSDEESEELGLYLQDLLIGRTPLEDEYEQRQIQAPEDLSPLSQLLAHFEKNPL
ncbi:hypothetical protein V8J88_17700 [Massilia sp. W12]|uniref:hypothetical protein n=1 Tax=Massilia sp. W12 TaxID=3126507 RepID=UPI0030CAA1A3